MDNLILTKVTNDFSWDKFTILIITLMALAVISFLLRAFFKNDGVRRFLIGLGCVFIILSGSFASASLIQYSTTKSSVTGSVSTPVYSKAIFNVNYSDFMFYEDTEKGNDQYYFFDEFQPVTFNGKDKDYRILVNGKPCSNNISEAGAVTGTYSMSFYDTQGEETSSVSILMKVYFYKDTIQLRMTTTKVGNNLANFCDHVLASGLNIQVVLFEG